MRNHEGDTISPRRPFCREARRHGQKGKRPRNRCRTMVLHWALRQQGSASLASNQPRDERPESPKRRDGASPSQSSPCNRMNNEELSVMGDSQMSKAMNSSGACEAGKRTRGNWRPDVAAVYFINGGGRRTLTNTKIISFAQTRPICDIIIFQ